MKKVVKMLSECVSRARVLFSIGSILLLCALQAGCGGGTMSSENFGETRIQGFVRDQSGAALSDVLVEIVETGDSTLTDSLGGFAISSALPDSAVMLSLSSESFEGSVSLPDIPAGTVLVSLALTLDSATGLVSVALIDPEEVEAPDPEIPDASDDDQQAGVPIRHHTVYRGSVLSSEGRPVDGVTVLVSNTGSSDTSDRNGRFSIRSRAVRGDTILKVIVGESKFNLRIRNIPYDRDITVSLSLVLVRTRRKHGDDSERYDAVKLGSIEVKTQERPVYRPA